MSGKSYLDMLNEDYFAGWEVSPVYAPPRLPQ